MLFRSTGESVCLTGPPRPWMRHGKSWTRSGRERTTAEERDPWKKCERGPRTHPYFGEQSHMLSVMFKMSVAVFHSSCRSFD